MSRDPISNSPAAFPETRWSLILSAPGVGDSRTALEDLARAYWRPVCAYVRARWATNEADALDATQDFFVWMLETGFVGRADPTRGRFRGFVKVSLDRFLVDLERKRRTLKRGGDRTFLTLGPRGPEGGDDAGGLELPEPEGRTPEQLLDATWRAELIQRATEGLERELEAEGRGVRFRIFRDYYLSESELDYVTVAERHDIKPSDVSNHLMAAKRRFREHLRQAVLMTVESSEDLDEELRWLLRDEPT